MTSLRTRLLLPLIVAVLASGGLNAWITWRSLADHFETQYQRRALVVMEAVTQAVGRATDAAELRQVVRVFGDEPDVARLIIAGGTPPRVIAIAEAGAAENAENNETRARLDQPVDTLPDRIGDDIARALSGEDATALSVARSERSLLRLISPIVLPGPADQPPGNAGPPGDARPPGIPMASGTASPAGGRGVVILHLDTQDAETELRRLGLVLTGLTMALSILLGGLVTALLGRVVLTPIGRMIADLRRRVGNGQDATDTAGFGDEVEEVHAALRRLLESQAEHERTILREKERAERYLEIAEAVIVALDRDGRVTLINNRGSRLLGFGSQDLLGRDWITTVVAPEYRDTVGRALQDLLSGQTLTNEYLEYEVIASAGQRLFLSWHNAVICKAGTAESGDPITGVLSSGMDVTPLKQVETRLRARNHEFALILDSAGEGIYGIDTAGRITSFNRAMERLTGYKRHDVIGRDAHALLHHAHADGSPCARTESPLLGALAGGGGGLRCANDLCWTEDGRWLPVESVATPIVDGTQVVGAVGIINDITDRLHMEQALRASEAKYRQLFENEQDAIVLVDHDSLHVLDANPAALRLFGFGRADFLKRKVLDFVSRPRRVQSYFADLRRVPTIRIPIWEQLNRNGEPLRLELTFTSYRESGRGVVAVIARDITDRMHAEEALRESEERFRATFEQAAVGIALVHPSGQLLRVNSRFCDIVGLAGDEVAAATLQRLTHPDDLETSLAGFRDLLSGKLTCYNQETRYLRGDTAEVWAELTMSLIRDIDGGAKYFIVVIEDISARKAAEQALMLAKAEAEAANLAKSRFIATMSHELRTPLNTILGFSEMIKDEALGPIGLATYAEYAGYINVSGNHLLDLITDVLDLSKIDAGKFEVEPVVVEVPHLLHGIARLLGERAEKHELAMVVDVATPIPYLWADLRAAKQILFNLASNAIKFTPPGGTITLRAWAEADGGISLSVADTGVGIPATQIGRVMMPFEQIDNRYSRAAGGTGLGLSLVKGLVDLHGGRLSIDSTVGVGTTITVHFLPMPPQA